MAQRWLVGGSVTMSRLGFVRHPAALIRAKRWSRSVAAEDVRSMRCIIVFAAASVVVAAAQAQFVTVPFGGPKKVRPPAAADLRGAPPDIAAAVGKRARPTAMSDLDESRQPVAVLEFLGLQLGALALVVAPDPAYYGEIVGDAVGPAGKVTLLLPPTTMKDPAHRAVVSSLIGRVPSVSIVAAAPDVVNLPPERYDFIVLDRTYASLAARPVFLAKLYAAARPGGVVGLIDTGDPMAARAEFVRSGFIPDGESAALRSRPGGTAKYESDTAAADATDRFVLRFHKPE